MFTARNKALTIAITTVLLMQCREPVNLQIRAEPAEHRRSLPENKDRDGVKDTNGPVLEEGKPDERELDKPAIQASDTLLPKMA